jgi:putative membrane protein
VSWRRHGFAVTDFGLLLRRGIVWRKLAVFPLARLQGVSLNQGPIDRIQLVSGAQVHTAPGPITGMLSGLERDDALQLLDGVSRAAAAAAMRDTTHRWSEHAAAAPAQDAPAWPSAPPVGQPVWPAPPAPTGPPTGQPVWPAPPASPVNQPAAPASQPPAAPPAPPTAAPVPPVAPPPAPPVAPLDAQAAPATPPAPPATRRSSRPVTPPTED